MLMYYNLLDCVHFVQVVQNLLQPYFQQGLDTFKSIFVDQWVAKVQRMKRLQQNTLFCLFSKCHKDPYKTLRSHLTGG